MSSKALPRAARKPAARSTSAGADRAAPSASASSTRSGGRRTLTYAVDLDNGQLANLTGALDANLRQIEDELNVAILRRGHVFTIRGAPVQAEAARQVLTHFAQRTAQPIALDAIQLFFVERRGGLAHLPEEAGQAGQAVRPKVGESHAAAAGGRSAQVRLAGTAQTLPPGMHVPDDSATHAVAKQDEATSPGADTQDPQLLTRRADLHGRTPRQRDYLRAIVGHDISFGIGPAGTGKTYLAVACAVDALERDRVKRIVLTRPAVEAGERLGFLPGDLSQKIDPYLRPLYDALFDLMGFEKTQKLLERQAIEVAPLAYMRGRTLNQAFVILDEAQNTTPEQMKMFLTRIGFGSRAVITGDVTQIDLPRHQSSGLVESQHILRDVKGIAFTYFSAADVVRHPLVARIVEAYEAADAAREAAQARGAGDGPHNLAGNFRTGRPRGHG